MQPIDSIETSVHGMSKDRKKKKEKIERSSTINQYKNV